MQNSVEPLGGVTTSVLRRAGDGPRVLLSHCSLAHSGAWKPLLTQRPDLDAVALDLPGHGQTMVDEARSPGRQAADAMLEVLGDGPAHLVGHSFGGRVVARVALDRPQAVASLTLVEPMMFHVLDEAGDPRAEDERVASQHYVDALANNDREGQARAFMSRWGNGVAWDDLPERTRAYAIERIHFIDRSGEEVMGNPPGQITLSALSTLTCPVRVIYGAQTVPAAIGIAEHVSRAVGVTPVGIPGAGHMVAISHAAEVAEHLPF